MNQPRERAMMRMLMRAYGREYDRNEEALLDEMQREKTVIEAGMILQGDTDG